MAYANRFGDVQAFQMTRERRENNIDWPAWLNIAWNMPYTAQGAIWCKNYPHSNGKDELLIRTSAGVQLVNFDDYIVCNDQAKILRIAPDVFEMLYKKVA